ncbi:MAG: sigma-54 dependent transcriptional regulator [Rectinemataceae bacterium]
MKRILIVDDDGDTRDILTMLFREDGFGVVTAENGKTAIEILERDDTIDLIISDMKMPVLGGKGIQEYLVAHVKRIPLLFITAYGTIPDAVRTIKKGAVDYITKPFKKDIIRHVVRRMLETKCIEGRPGPRISQRFSEPVYRSSAMTAIMATVRKISTGRAPVLILGQSGTGKEIIARALHAHSPEKPFVKVNCAAIPGTLIESELFGYRKGAFTGASANFAGKAKAADGGMLFLDEIGDLAIEVQPKLLRLIEEKSFEPLGSTTPVNIETRIVCATNRDLKALIKAGTFREDLYYRINTITITIPPLAARKEDLAPLIDYFLQKSAESNGVRPKAISDAARETLLRYEWPGNVRELRNVIERSVVLSSGDSIEASDLPREISGVPTIPVPKGEDRLSSSEVKLIEESLTLCAGNVTAAAKILGVTRDTLRYRMKKYNIGLGEITP